MDDEKRNHVRVTRLGTLLPLLVSADITDTQMRAIEIIVRDQRMAFNVVEDARITERLTEQRVYSPAQPLVVERYFPLGVVEGAGDDRDLPPAD